MSLRRRDHGASWHDLRADGYMYMYAELLVIQSSCGGTMGYTGCAAESALTPN